MDYKKIVVQAIAKIMKRKSDTEDLRLNKQRKIDDDDDDDSSGGDQSSESSTSPLEYVHSALEESGYQTQIEAFSLEDTIYFLPYQEGHLPFEILQAVRENNVDTIAQLRKFSPSLLEQRNQFGESLVHLSCKYGRTDICRYLIEKVVLPLNVRDSCGRSPLHNACIQVSPNWEILELLLEQAPEQMLFLDNCGKAPFHYIRESQWKRCIQFLSDHKNQLTLQQRFKKPELVQPLRPTREICLAAAPTLTI
jgi:hypothetical protein